MPTTDCEEDVQSRFESSLPGTRVKKEAGECALKDNYRMIRTISKFDNQVLEIES